MKIDNELELDVAADLTLASGQSLPAGRYKGRQRSLTGAAAGQRSDQPTRYRYTIIQNLDGQPVKIDVSDEVSRNLITVY